MKVITYVYTSDIYGSPFFLVQPNLNIGIDKAIGILPCCFARLKKTGIEGERDSIKLNEMQLNSLEFKSFFPYYIIIYIT